MNSQPVLTVQCKVLVLFHHGIALISQFGEMEKEVISTLLYENFSTPAALEFYSLQELNQPIMEKNEPFFFTPLHCGKLNWANQTGKLFFALIHTSKLMHFD